VAEPLPLEGRPRVVGLDLSLTATGVACDVGESTIAPKTRGMRRLYDILTAVLDVCSLGVDLVVVEGYAFASATASYQLGELGGVVRLALWLEGVPVVVVSPSTLKKWATGNGGAKKEAVLAAAIRRLGYSGSDHNQADAMWLRAGALDHYGFAMCAMPGEQRAALDKVDWPELATRGAA
jgi:Holliday junction resolvasome RuvABC endonuclease subunit